MIEALRRAPRPGSAHQLKHRGHDGSDRRSRDIIGQSSPLAESHAFATTTTMAADASAGAVEPPGTYHDRFDFDLSRQPASASDHRVPWMAEPESSPHSQLPISVDGHQRQHPDNRQLSGHTIAEQHHRVIHVHDEDEDCNFDVDVDVDVDDDDVIQQHKYDAIFHQAGGIRRDSDESNRRRRHQVATRWSAEDVRSETSSQPKIHSVQDGALAFDDRPHGISNSGPSWPLQRSAYRNGCDAKNMTSSSVPSSDSMSSSSLSTIHSNLPPPPAIKRRSRVGNPSRRDRIIHDIVTNKIQPKAVPVSPSPCKQSDTSIIHGAQILRRQILEKQASAAGSPNFVADVPTILGGDNDFGTMDYNVRPGAVNHDAALEDAWNHTFGGDLGFLNPASPAAENNLPPGAGQGQDSSATFREDFRGLVERPTGSGNAGADDDDSREDYSTHPPSPGLAPIQEMQELEELEETSNNSSFLRNAHEQLDRLDEQWGVDAPSPSSHDQTQPKHKHKHTRKHWQNSKSDPDHSGFAPFEMDPKQAVPRFHSDPGKPHTSLLSIVASSSDDFGSGESDDRGAMSHRSAFRRSAPPKQKIVAAQQSAFTSCPTACSGATSILARDGADGSMYESPIHIDQWVPLSSVDHQNAALCDFKSAAIIHESQDQRLQSSHACPFVGSVLSPIGPKYISMTQTDTGFRHALKSGTLWQSLVSQHVRFPKAWWNGARHPPMGVAPSIDSTIPLGRVSSSVSAASESTALGGTTPGWRYFGRHRVGDNPVLNNQFVKNRGSAGRILLHILVQDMMTLEPVQDIAIGVVHPNARGIRPSNDPYDPQLEDCRDVWMALRSRNSDTSVVQSLIQGHAEHDSPLGQRKAVNNLNMRVVFGDQPPEQTLFLQETELYDLLSSPDDVHEMPPALVLLETYLR
eukprot:CAMPEP_0119552500 /NCGR_PEP_ID=MMETSP1352-20130426/5471_1 /TAXON_ID=265584 /ORGANISM="Stauroneis constricta, Strain CCMP1120" /LENGTH=914 /DNA_ID=CAMNT_0007598741 /DNA_START=9 /DNA_END=2753 /DNA_ORIENTATION=+